MGIRRFTLAVGIFYVALGVCGFIPQLVLEPWSTVVTRNTNSPWTVGMLFWCLPVTFFVNALRIAIGAAALLSAARLPTAQKFCQGLSGLAGAMVVVGVLPYGINSLWGLLPLTGGNLALHMITAPMAFYFGWVATFEGDVEPDLA